jgi:small GTP-binding protein
MAAPLTRSSNERGSGVSLVAKPISEYKPKLKVILLGQSGAGKTSLLGRYRKPSGEIVGQENRPFNSNIISTIGIDFVTNTTNYLGKDYNIQIWDTSGQERFGAITQAYFRDALVAIIVFDVCDAESYAKATAWLQHRCSLNEKNTWGDITVLVGTKCDRESDRVIDKHTAHEYAVTYGVQYFDASALNGDGVHIIFDTAILMAISLTRADQKNTVSGKISLEVQAPPEKKKCNCVIL